MEANVFTGKGRTMDLWKKILFGSMAMFLVLAATGCNTFRGMGKDIQKGGEAVENAADEVEDEI